MHGTLTLIRFESTTENSGKYESSEMQICKRNNVKAQIIIDIENTFLIKNNGMGFTRYSICGFSP
jgi:hypothetical protein